MLSAEWVLTELSCAPAPPLFACDPQLFNRDSQATDVLLSLGSPLVALLPSYPVLSAPSLERPAFPIPTKLTACVAPRSPHTVDDPVILSRANLDIADEAENNDVRTLGLL